MWKENEIKEIYRHWFDLILINNWGIGVPSFVLLSKYQSCTYATTTPISRSMAIQWQIHLWGSLTCKEKGIKDIYRHWFDLLLINNWGDWCTNIDPIVSLSCPMMKIFWFDLDNQTYLVVALPPSTTTLICADRLTTRVVG